ncbi:MULTISPECIES: transcription antitermination factor NusB [unclassified Halomonas]|uniref:transcription antitermination factor NusB n=1 Tax=unclassified Halomonas TaxID=2609666 RepID=UPI0021E50F32|nr:MULTISPECIES: transcription antitermination factor NusB [unclassified Halomonas]UYF98725.1 transcription antitermination factor NusB [Halomonas sp. GD1P12]WNL40163.1 transcription antitermination factor NusB [Halomonas sp. PAMB 3232]WNL43474.1 transcription antitermination factor NusB [Halomonas sp. PAMB 3264]
MSERPERKQSAAQQARRAARELTVQALYQWDMTGKSATTVEAEFRSQLADDDLEDHENWVKVMEIADKALFHTLLHETVRHKSELDREIAPLLDRRLEDLDAVELAILRLGAYELAKRPEVPYRVAINEGVELAKSFGATDGHKYVNGILDKLANRLRSAEVSARRL